MQTLMIVVGWILLAATVAYLYSFWRFHAIVNAERPDWIQRKRTLTSFSTGLLPQAFDPNVSMAVLQLVFSQRIHQVRSPMGIAYAKRIRVLGVTCAFLFVIVLVLVAANAP